MEGVEKWNRRGPIPTLETLVAGWAVSPEVRREVEQRYFDILHNIHMYETEKASVAKAVVTRLLKVYGAVPPPVAQPQAAESKKKKPKKKAAKKLAKKVRAKPERQEATIGKRSKAKPAEKKPAIREDVLFASRDLWKKVMPQSKRGKRLFKRSTTPNFFY